MHCKLIILFLFFEITVFYATAKCIFRNETFSWTTSQRNQCKPDALFVLVNPKRIQHAEVIINHFLAKLTPIAADESITLRLSFPDKANLQEIIKAVSKKIRGKVMEFAQVIGLTKSVCQDQQTLWNSTIPESWLTESLIQGSLLLCDLIRTGEEIRSAIDHYFKAHNMILYEDLLPRKITENFQFFNIINEATSFSKKLFECLSEVTTRRNSSSFFNLNRALVNLAKDSPANTVKSFKSSLDRAFVRSVPSNDTTSEQFHMLLCYSLVEKVNHYNDCIKELRHFVTCVSSSRNQDSSEAITQKVFPKLWLLLVIHHLYPDVSSTSRPNNTDEKDEMSIQYKLDQKLPKTTTQRVKYIYEKILDQRIPRQSSLHRVVKELGNVLSRSTWGRQLTHDICQYFAIYQEGQRRLNILSRSNAEDKIAAMRYKRMFVSLNTYKNGILKNTMLTIRNVHRSALEIQKFLIRGIRSSFNESWESHYKILYCLSEWMKKLLRLFECANLNDIDDSDTTMSDISLLNITDSSSNEIDKSNQTRHLTIYSKDQIREEADIVFEKLLRSMNHASKMRSQNYNSTLACLANNLLLVTMFIETISFVSTLCCLGDHKNESSIDESMEDGLSPISITSEKHHPW